MDNLTSVKELQSGESAYRSFYPDVKNLKYIRDLENERVIFIDAIVFNYLTPFSEKKSAYILACLEYQQNDISARFKMLTSNVVIVDMVERYKAKGQINGINKVVGTICRKLSAKNHVLIWYWE
jgi:hypothetical protein